MSTNPETQPAPVDPGRVLDRSRQPAVPASVADLWDGWGYNGSTEPQAMAVAVKGIGSIVNALAGGERPFAVSLTGTATAWTDLKARRVAITTAALRDERLTLVERLGITTAMAVHEAGHGRLTAPMQRAVYKAFGDPALTNDPRAARAHRLSNIAEDERLEARTSARWAAYAGLFPLAMWWVAQRYPSGKITRLPESRDQAINLGLAAIRYRAHTAWDETVPGLAAERTWWEQWGVRIAATDKPKEHVALITEALQHIEHLPEQPPAPPAPPQPAPGEAGDEDEGDDEDGDESEDGDPTEGDDESEGWGDEDADEDAEQSEGEGRGESDDDADEDWDDDEDADGEGSGESDEDDESEPLDADGLPGGGGSDDEGEDETDPEDVDWDRNAPSAPTTLDKDADESDEDEDADEDGDGDDESDEDDDAGWDDEDGDLLDDDGEHTEGGEVTETYRDAGSASHDDEPADEDGEDGPITYGHDEDADGQDTTPGEMQGTEQDALTAPLPAHATDAVTDDDRNLDRAVDTLLAAEARAESHDYIEVTHQTPGGQAKVSVAVKPLVSDKVRTETSPEVQGALRAAFTSRRTAKDNRDVARSGRVSGHRAFRVAAGFDNVFTRRDSISPDRLDLHLLVDASGSMSGGGHPARWGMPAEPNRIAVAGTLVANIAEALQRLPYVRVHVWAHNTWDGTTLWDVYDSRRGEPIARVRSIKATGGNNDASAIAALAHRVLRERSNRERSIIVVMSDGAPCEDRSWVRAAAESARQKNIGVVSVAVAGGLTETQEDCYGAEMVVPWTGDWNALGAGIAKIVGKLA